MGQIKRYVDSEGVQEIVKALSLDDYPNNEILVAVINAINGSLDSLSLDQCADLYYRIHMNNTPIGNGILLSFKEVEW